MPTILRGIVGSTAYGLHHENSDIDRLGCFVEPTIAFHGINAPKASRVQKEPSDYTEHEAGKYVSLLLKCNPTAMELLWLPDDLYELVHPEGLGLIEIRKHFLSAKAVRNAYLGYATQQFRRLTERGDGSFSSDTRKRTAKHARHLRRLCWQGFVLYSTGQLPIRVENPDEYHIFGEQVAETPGLAQVLIDDYKDLFNMTESVLPETPNEAVALKWLLDVRELHYDGRRYGDLAPDEKARHYMNKLIQWNVVSYTTINQCQRALDNLTRGFSGANEVANV